MKYLLFANPVTGSPILKKLIQSNNGPSAVITFFNDTDNYKRLLVRLVKGKLTVEDRCKLFYNIPVYDYYSINEKRLEKILEKNNISIGFITTFSKIIPNNILNKFKKGVFNLHPSLLPKHGGANPFFWIIYNRDEFTGTTCHLATSTLDAGDVYWQTRYEVGNKDSIDLFNHYSNDTVKIISEMLTDYEQLKLNKKKQNDIQYDPKSIPTVSELRSFIKSKSDINRINKALRFYKKSI